MTMALKMTTTPQAQALGPPVAPRNWSSKPARVPQRPAQRR